MERCGGQKEYLIFYSVLKAFFVRETQTTDIDQLADTHQKNKCNTYETTEIYLPIDTF